MKKEKPENHVATIIAVVTSDELRLLDVWKSVNEVRSRREAIQIILKEYFGVPQKDNKTYKQVKLEDIKKIIS